MSEKEHPESKQAKIARFQDRIQKRFKCSAEYVREQPCDLLLSRSGNASVFRFLGSPAKYPEAKSCFVWDSSEFKPGSTGTVILADVEVLDDSEQLPCYAVFTWLTKSWVDDADRDIYVSSRKWTKEKLHGQAINFRWPTREPQSGFFFVRESKDGKISVRIRQEDPITFDGREEFVDRSFRLTLAQIERIEELNPGMNDFTVDL